MTFTKEELERLVKDYKDFQDRCRVVCSILLPINPDFDELDEWEFDIETSKVEGHGLDNDGYHYDGDFPADYLTKTDEELRDIVNQILKQRKEERKKEEMKKKKERLKRKMKKEEKLKRKELSELKRLKEKYEKED